MCPLHVLALLLCLSPRVGVAAHAQDAEESAFLLTTRGHAALSQARPQARPQVGGLAHFLSFYLALGLILVLGGRCTVESPQAQYRRRSHRVAPRRRFAATRVGEPGAEGAPRTTVAPGPRISSSLAPVPHRRSPPFYAHFIACIYIF